MMDHKRPRESEYDEKEIGFPDPKRHRSEYATSEAEYASNQGASLQNPKIANRTTNPTSAPVVAKTPSSNGQGAIPQGSRPQYGGGTRSGHESDNDQESHDNHTNLQDPMELSVAPNSQLLNKKGKVEKPDFGTGNHVEKVAMFGKSHESEPNQIQQHLVKEKEIAKPNSKSGNHDEKTPMANHPPECLPISIQLLLSKENGATKSNIGTGNSEEKADLIGEPPKPDPVADQQPSAKEEELPKSTIETEKQDEKAAMVKELPAPDSISVQQPSTKEDEAQETKSERGVHSHEEVITQASPEPMSTPIQQPLENKDKASKSQFSTEHHHDTTVPTEESRQTEFDTTQDAPIGGPEQPSMSKNEAPTAQSDGEPNHKLRFPSPETECDIRSNASAKESDFLKSKATKDNPPGNSDVPHEAPKSKPDLSQLSLVKKNQEHEIQFEKEHLGKYADADQEMVQKPSEVEGPIDFQYYVRPQGGQLDSAKQNSVVKPKSLENDDTMDYDLDSGLSNDSPNTIKLPRGARPSFSFEDRKSMAYKTDARFSDNESNTIEQFPRSNPSSMKSAAGEASLARRDKQVHDEAHEAITPDAKMLNLARSESHLSDAKPAVKNSAYENQKPRFDATKKPKGSAFKDSTQEPPYLDRTDLETTEDASLTPIFRHTFLESSKPSRFPRFRGRDASVYIILSGANTNYHFKLHRKTLAAVSFEFSQSLQEKIEEADQELADRMLPDTNKPVLYELKGVGKSWKLVRQPFTALVSNANKNESKVNHKLQETPLNILRTYKNFLSVIYNTEIVIDPAYEIWDCVSLAWLASKHGPKALQTASEAIRGAFGQVGQRIFREAKNNPPLYLEFAEILENGPLYKEAMIHLVGIVPDWNSKWKVPPNLIRPISRDLLNSKHWDLEEKKKKINKDLHLNGITIGDDNGNQISVSTVADYKGLIDLSDEQSELFEGYIVQAMWRNFVSEHITKDPFEIGKFYRLISKGGDAYLKSDHVKTLLPPSTQSSVLTWEFFEKDMAIMKDYAARRVQELVVNNSVLKDVGKEEITWLTCTEISDDELPWNSARTKIRNNELL